MLGNHLNLFGDETLVNLFESLISSSNQTLILRFYFYAAIKIH